MAAAKKPVKFTRAVNKRSAWSGVDRVGDGSGKHQGWARNDLKLYSTGETPRIGGVDKPPRSGRTLNPVVTPPPTTGTRRTPPKRGK